MNHNNSSQKINKKHFSTDWFSNNIPTWNNYKPMFFNKSNIHCLEVGSFEGRSTIYTAENYCNGEGSYIDALDTWEGSVEHSKSLKTNLYERFLNNVKQYIDEGRVKPHKAPSSKTLMSFVQEGKKYDFIYIDASHIARDVLFDSVLSWELLKTGGVMAFDDYKWEYNSIPSMTPKPAIDGFLASNNGTYNILHQDYQIHILKTLDHPLINQLLYRGVIDGDSDTIKDALSRGAEINHLHTAGGTALYWAVQDGKFEEAKILLNAGANPDIKAANNETPLTMSVQNNDLKMTKLLIESGANIETPNGFGATPLYVSAYFGFDDILKLLLDNGANKNVEVGGLDAFNRALKAENAGSAQILAGSTENFCHQILNTEYASNYVELCGEANTEI